MQTSNKTVVIGIQARSTSTRFPEKIFQIVGSKRVLEHVIDKAKSAKEYLHRYVKDINIQCHIAVLYPYGDNKIRDCFSHTGINFIEGDEFDVLSRYTKAQKMFNADFVTRLTSDCPLILDFIINKHIRSAVYNNLDYVSNIEETCRQVADGFDCEVFSKLAIEWLEANVKTDYDKEHVTTAIRRERPKGILQGFVSSKQDSSDIKLSLDTEEDLKRIREYFHKREHKMEQAKRIFGSRFIYEL